jgi:RNA polymerase sigma-70 factor (ECF subfamily)
MDGGSDAVGKSSAPAPTATVLRRSLADLDDRALLLRSAEGDRAAFGVLVERHATTLQAILRQRLGRQVPLDDLLQEIFARTLANVGAFRGGSSYVTWATSIGLNLAIDWQRKKTRRRRLAPPSELENDAVPHPNSTHPLETLEHRDEAQRARALMETLPTDQRVAITLRVVQELSYGDVARRMDVPVARVRTWVSRGLKKLRVALERPEVSK